MPPAPQTTATSLLQKAGISTSELQPGNTVKLGTGQGITGQQINLQPLIDSANKPPTEPPVLGSPNIDNKNADNKSTLNNATQNKGDYTDPQGIQRHADGSIIPGQSTGETPSGVNGQWTKGDWKINPTTGIEEFVNAGQQASWEKTNPTDPAVLAQQQKDAVEAQQEKDVDALQSRMDAASAAMISSIRQQYEGLKTQQKDVNMRSEASRSQALLMGGSSRYAPVSSDAIQAQQESYGYQQIADLQTKEDSAIAQAQMAMDQNDMQALDKKISLYQTYQKDKQDAMQKMQDQAQKTADAQKVVTEQANKDSAISSAFSSGVTDPSAILAKLRASGDTTTNLQDISGALNIIAKNVGAPDTSKLSQDAQLFYKLKGEPGGLPVSILGLGSTEEQFAAFLKMNNQAQAGGTAAGKVANTPAPSVGNSGSTITTPTTGSINNDVTAVLEGRNTLFNIRQTMGRTNAAAAYMQKMRDSITKIDPQFDFVASDAGGKSVSTGYVQRATAAINSVMPNIDKVVDLSNQVSRVGIKGVDALLQKGAIQIGNQKVSNFQQAQKLIADEIGVALGAGTVSDMKLQLGFDVTDPSVKPEVFASNMAIVKDFINNRKQGLDALRYKSGTTSTLGGSTSIDFLNNPIPSSGTGAYSPNVWPTATTHTSHGASGSY